MATKKSEPRRKAEPQTVDIAAIERSLTACSHRLSNAVPKRRGSILLQFTDLNEECCVEATGPGARVMKGAGAAPVLVRIAGPSSVLKAIMDGKKEASRAFVAGGIQVSGDLIYLETLLKDLGLLNCE